MVSTAESPPNARLPESISYSTAPKAKMSVRKSAASPRTCSGDMYPAVPSTVPGIVATAVTACGCASIGSVSFARPKSRIFARPSVVTKMFSGLRSRCTMPR